MTAGFPPDYMHISLALSVDFPRKCRGVVDLDRWKASELRQLLLYTGPVVLRDILHPNVNECFILFTFFPQHYADFLVDASKVFVSKFAAIFGPSHIGYNVYLFSHLFNLIELYRCLDRFSCFSYEPELGHLKHYIHGPKLPAVLLYRRLNERVGLDAVERKIFLDDVGLPLPDATGLFIGMSFFRKSFPTTAFCLMISQMSLRIFLEILLSTRNSKLLSHFTLTH
ncbi:hypothetical protein T265_10019 [Opisthorchis viverrini]|uniref:Uncharacterized protein n=1 Tax=Opisthorchis viverrini TaxID=6198 RepID=A0A074Z3U9_OPIVI|nr:hypothetical protein T265_10019 [Opisthorchis viverrini]KER21713.1 hypothetical protein T265_10019 [Opisthorchis viverrini]